MYILRLHENNFDFVLGYCYQSGVGKVCFIGGKWKIQNVCFRNVLPLFEFLDLNVTRVKKGFV